ncbi:odorant receptor 22c-like [Harpegnathos saltator]|uniref:odorant receptor 22c-like n=1 Tax=Harpegnathos saltator TaxID=610380 RepID=UPI00058FA407|nr:odorant receptor 22c-like [Harpegnathos saltator]
MDSNAQWNDAADATHFLTFYKNLLGIVGIWVLDEKSVFSRTRWFVSTMVEMSTAVTLSLEVIRHCKGHEDALNAFLTGSSSIVSISKLLLHRVNWRYKLLLVEAVVHDWTSVKDPYSRDIMLKYARIGRFGALVFLYLGLASLVYFASVLVFSNVHLPWISEWLMHNRTGERKLALAAYCVFGKYLSSAYVLIGALQLLQVFVDCMSHCGNDGFFFDLTMHVCGQLEILRTSFTEMNGDEILLRDKLDALLKRHRQLICLAYYLEKAFNMVILAQVLMSVILVCVEGFQLILMLTINDVFSAAKHVLFMAVLLVQLFLYCFAGQTLELQSEGLAYAIYESRWYSFDVNVIKDLSFVILRASKPHQLTAGKFLAINFMSFKEILKASASYLSVLRVMLET